MGDNCQEEFREHEGYPISNHEGERQKRNIQVLQDDPVAEEYGTDPNLGLTAADELCSLGMKDVPYLPAKEQFSHNQCIKLAW